MLNSMNYKQLKTHLKIKTELYIHYSTMYGTALGELKFEKLQADFHRQTLEEVKTLCNNKVNQKLIGKVIDNALERADLDKMIHVEILFK